MESLENPLENGLMSAICRIQQAYTVIVISSSHLTSERNEARTVILITHIVKLSFTEVKEMDYSV